MNATADPGPRVTLYADVADYLAAMHAAADMGGHYG